MREQDFGQNIMTFRTFFRMLACSKRASSIAVVQSVHVVAGVVSAHEAAVARLWKLTECVNVKSGGGGEVSKKEQLVCCKTENRGLGIVGNSFRGTRRGSLVVGVIVSGVYGKRKSSKAAFDFMEIQAERVLSRSSRVGKRGPHCTNQLNVGWPPVPCHLTLESQEGILQLRVLQAACRLCACILVHRIIEMIVMSYLGKLHLDVNGF